MKEITSILFDVDGTLLDTGEFIIQATEHALRSHGHTVPDRSVISKAVGAHFPEYYHMLAGRDADAEQLVETHREFQYKNYHLVKPFPGTMEVLRALKEKGYKIAAVTTRSKKTSIQTIEDAGIEKYFDAIISWEDVAEHKPHPEPLLKALDLVGGTPDKAVMIGDSHLDVEAGKNAGTMTIRAGYGFHKENMHDPEPDIIIDNISDLLKIL